MTASESPAVLRPAGSPLIASDRTSAGGPSAGPWEGAHLPSGVYRWGLVGVVLLGAILRIAHIARPFNRLMAWNEGHYAMIALNFDRYGLWSQHNELGVDRTLSPGVPWLIWASFKFFGTTEWAARLPIALSGIVAIALLAAVVRRLMRSEQIALIAAAFVAVAPGVVYYAQNVQLDTPSICCALGAAVLMLRYREARRRADAAWAGIWLAVAIWFKFTAVLLYPAFLVLWWPVRPAQPVVAAAAASAFAALTALPSFLWIASGWLTFRASEGFTHRFFYRDWDLRGLVKAFLEIPLAVEVHLFIPIFLLLIVSVPLAVRWRTRMREIWVWCVPWAIPYILAPWESLVNRYYDLPATYLLTVPAALRLWMMGEGAVRRTVARATLTGLGVVLALTVAYDAWDPMTDRIARATTPHAASIDPSPFYSAKIVAALPRGRTIADTPQTMFYGGGDPAWIEITGGDVRWKIDGEEFDYIILNDYSHGQEPYYVIDDALREQLARHHYMQIAPAAWAHERTVVGNLNGRPRLNVPYWSPEPVLLLRGMAVWQ